MGDYASTKRIKSVRLDEARLKALLDRLDEEEIGATGSEHQAHTPYPYRLPDAVVNILQPGGSAASFLVPTRSLSQAGLSFLHGAYLHNGTQCQIKLASARNMWQSFDASVVRCKYVEGAIHDVGVTFDKHIDVSIFAAEAVSKRVLLVDDDPAIRRLVKFHLEQLNAKVTLAEGGESAVDKALENRFDCVLMDLEMPGLDGLTAVKKLREGGYTGTVVALAATTDPHDRERCLAAGFDNYLAKPLVKETLIELLRTLNKEPLSSSMARSPIKLT